MTVGGWNWNGGLECQAELGRFLSSGFVFGLDVDGGTREIISNSDRSSLATSLACFPVFCHVPVDLGRGSARRVEMLEILARRIQEVIEREIICT